LNEDILSVFDKPVAQFALDTDIGDLPVTVVVGAWSIPIQWVPVWVCALYPKHNGEVNLVL
jgi:hypothetical protein